MVIIDISFLAHRSRWTVGELSYKGTPTGVIYGTIMQLRNIQKIYPPKTAFVLAWDTKHEFSLRKQILPQYKVQKQKEYTPEELQEKNDFSAQLEVLPEVLSYIGFDLSISAKGFEADDVIACLCQWATARPGIVKQVHIASADHDLFQLLNHGPMYRPDKGRNYTKEHLLRDFNVEPNQWAMVQAIAGCTTDGVTGVHGVGEKTAAKYLNGGKVTANKLVAIKRAKRLIDRNLQVVSLPFQNIDLVPPAFVIHPFKVDVDGCSRVGMKYGFASFHKEFMQWEKQKEEARSNNVGKRLF